MARRARIWIEDEREALLDELDESGMSVAAFARERGVSAWTIYSWRRQERECAAELESPEFLQVKVAPLEEESPALEVELTDGVRVRVPGGFDEDELQRLLGVLATC